MGTSASAPLPAVQPAFGRRVSLLLGPLFLIAGMLMPPAAHMHPMAPRAFGLMAAAISLWVTEALHPAVTGLLVVVGLVVSGILPLAEAGSGLGHPNLWLMLGAFVLSHGIERSGLGRRFALAALVRGGSSPASMVLMSVLTIAAGIFVIPSPVARVALIVPFLQGAFQTAKMRPGGNLARSLFLTAGPASVVASSGVVTGAAGVIYAQGLFAEIGHPVSYLQWAGLMLPGVLVVLVAMWRLVLWLFPPELEHVDEVHASLKRQRQELGPLTRVEWRVLALVALVVAGVGGESLTGLEPGIVFVVAAALSVLPGIGLGSWEEAARKVDWSTLILFGATLGLAQGMIKTGAFTWLAGAVIQPGLRVHPILLGVGVLVLATVVRLGLTNQSAVNAVVLPVAIELGRAQGVNPIWLGMIAVVGAGISFLHPAQSPSLLATYTMGHYSARDLFRLGVPFTVVIIAVTLALAWFYWPLLGVSPFL